jgi:ubiquinone/menaquinone biosynthesis C-methylase UbiE
MHHSTLRKGGMVMGNPVYTLGHSDEELERLRVQSRFVEPITRQFFQEAGISAGMRVLDVGSGTGDVAFLTTDLVGETGEVIGTDKATAALSIARQRAAAKGSHNVSFRAGDPTEIAFDRPFDAVVGRYVLLFQADPAGMVRVLMKQHLRPGGFERFP